MLSLLFLALSVSASLIKGPIPPDPPVQIELQPPDSSNPAGLLDPLFGPISPSGERRRRAVEEESGEEEDKEEEEENGKKKSSPYYEYLYKWMKEDAAKTKKKKPFPDVYKIPGPQEPLPGRSHTGDYWPVFPFQNQYSGGLDLDPSISRHIGGDMNLAVPSWGMLDIYGRFFNRIRDTTTKFGYLNHPVNMLDLDRQDFVKLMSDPSLHWNRNAQPRLPLGKLARTYVPLNCKPPLCNPYTMTFGLGIEHDYGGNDGVEGDIDVPIPISKGVAYRLPFSGKIYYALENITVTYGQNLAPIDPMHSLFDYQYTRDPNIGIPRDRRRRDVSQSTKVWQSEPSAKSFAEHVASGGKEKSGPFRTRMSSETTPRFEGPQQETRLVAVPYIVPDYPPLPYYPPPPYQTHSSYYQPPVFPYFEQPCLEQLLYPRRHVPPQGSGDYSMLYQNPEVASFGNQLGAGYYNPEEAAQFIPLPDNQWYSDPVMGNLV